MKFFKPHRYSSLHHGFSLIELLVVMTILLVIASAGFLTLSENQDQSRYDETVSRYNSLREVIIGRKEIVTLNGSPVSTGYISDVGVLPTLVSPSIPIPPLERFVNNLTPAGALKDPVELTLSPADHYYKPYSIFGSELSRGDVIAPENLAHFNNVVFNTIKFSDGWRGPYIQRTKSDTTVVKDGWDNEFVLAPRPLTQDEIDDANTKDPNLPDYFLLFSGGKGGEDDDVVALNPDDELGYEEDFPVGEKRRILPTEYEVAPVPIPNNIIIEISKEQAEFDIMQENFYIGLIFPGLSLENNMGAAFRAYTLARPSSDSPPVGADPVSLAPTVFDSSDPDFVDGAISLGREETNGLLTTLADLEELGTSPDDPTLIQFRLTRTDGQSLFFNKPLARRYQIAIFEKGRIIGDKSNNNGFFGDRLGDAILGVYPQLFQFIPGTNPEPSLSSSPVWRVPTSIVP